MFACRYILLVYYYTIYYENCAKKVQNTYMTSTAMVTLNIPLYDMILQF